MDSHQLDARNLDNLFIPYDETVKAYINTPHWVDGIDMVTNRSGTLRPRPGFLTMPDNNVYATNVGRIDRLVTYETFDNPSHVYLVASIWQAGSGLWGAYYLKIDGSLGGAATVGTWTSLGNFKFMQESTRVHEFEVARGLCYIKSFPASSTSEFYGTTVFNGGSGNIVIDFWGLPSPTQPVRMTASAGWNAATNPVSVLYGWYYFYTWKSRTGQYSTRSPIESDPANPLSTTGAFTNKKPAFKVRGHADTTRIPKIGIWRTTDGGGTPYFVEDITNTGDVDITYEDNHRVSTTTNDPKTDLQLDTTNICPSQVSNMAPPPVDEQHVTGTDQIQPSTNIAYWQRRMWYGIHRLYESGQEEIANGIPEESFPNPNGVPGQGNFYQFRNAPRMVCPTQNGMYCVTSEEIQRFTGEDLTNIRPTFVDNIGGYPNQTEACFGFRDTMFFVTRDNQIAAVTGNDPAVIISQPISTTLKSLLNGIPIANLNITMDIYSRDGNLWLITNIANTNSISQTRQLVYDINNGIWFTPWSGRFSCMHFGLWKNSQTVPEFMAVIWDGTNSSIAALNQSSVGDVGGYGIFPYVTLGMMVEPSGDHVNSLRVQSHASMLAYVVLVGDLLNLGSDLVDINYKIDSTGDSFVTGVTSVNPPYSNSASVANYMRWYPIYKSGYWFQIKFFMPNNIGHIQNISLVFQPETGA